MRTQSDVQSSSQIPDEISQCHDRVRARCRDIRAQAEEHAATAIRGQRAASEHSDSCLRRAQREFPGDPDKIARRHCQLLVEDLRELSEVWRRSNREMEMAHSRLAREEIAAAARDELGIQDPRGVPDDWQDVEHLIRGRAVPMLRLSLIREPGASDA